MPRPIKCDACGRAMPDKKRLAKHRAVYHPDPDSVSGPVNYRRQPGMEQWNEEALAEMLRVTHDKRTVEEFLQDIREASFEELQAWHAQARKMRWAFGVVLDRIEDTPLPEDRA